MNFGKQEKGEGRWAAEKKMVERGSEFNRLRDRRMRNQRERETARSREVEGRRGGKGRREFRMERKISWERDFPGLNSDGRRDEIVWAAKAGTICGDGEGKVIQGNGGAEDGAGKSDYVMSLARSLRRELSKR